MDDDADVRAFLSRADTPPSRVDLTTVIADGQQRVRRRWAVAVAGSTAAVLAGLVGVPAAIATVRGERSPDPAVVAGLDPSASPSAAPTPFPSPSIVDPEGAAPTPSATAGTCVAKPLKLPSGVKRAKALSVDPTGRYIGGQEDGKQSRGIMWTDGRPTILPIDEYWVEVDSVNEHGVATGIAQDNAGKVEYVFRYAAGKVTKLTNVAGYTHVFPTPRINAAGDIVINAETSGSVEGADSIAMIWKAGTTVAKRIPLKTTDSVLAITDDGTLVGAHYTNSQADGAAAWTPSGQETKLENPAGTKAAAYAARGDWATGGVWPGGDRQTTGAPLWNIKTGAVTMLPGGVSNAVNSSGLVISENSQLVRAGGTAPQLPAPPSGSRNYAADLSDAGLVVGSITSDSTSAAMTWTC
jgi:hypothetical protein